MEETRLTPDLLIALGFRGEGKEVVKRPAYRLHIPKHAFGYHYWYQLQVSLGNYPDTNPNSGIVSLYHPGIKDLHYYDHESIGTKPSKFDSILWEEEGRQYGISFKSLPEQTFAIAHRVVTLERLNAIYCALTGNPPLVPTERYPSRMAGLKQLWNDSLAKQPEEPNQDNGDPKPAE